MNSKKAKRMRRFVEQYANSPSEQKQWIKAIKKGLKNEHKLAGFNVASHKPMEHANKSRDDNDNP